MPGQEFYDQVKEDWNYNGNKDMYLGFSSAAVPESVQSAKEVLLPETKSIWGSMTDYGLDKVSHGGFSYFGSRMVMNACQNIPEYMIELTEEQDDTVSRKLNDLGWKLSDPSFQVKALTALSTVAVLGMGKEMTDTYIDYLDMTANMTGASLGVLNEYGEGSIRNGAKLAFNDIQEMLSGEENAGKESVTDGGYKLSEDVLENQKMLGKV